MTQFSIDYFLKNFSNAFWKAISPWQHSYTFFVEQISGAYYRENILIKTKSILVKTLSVKIIQYLLGKGNLNNSTYISNTKKIDKLLKKKK